MPREQVRTTVIDLEIANGIKQLCKEIGITQREFYESERSIWAKFTLVEYRQIINGGPISPETDSHFLAIWGNLRERKLLLEQGKISEPIEKRHKREAKQLRHQQRMDTKALQDRHHAERHTAKKHV